jgi:hypothetical protein
MRSGSAEVFVVGTNPARPIGPKDCTYQRFMGSLKGNNEDFQDIYAEKGISETTSRVNELLKAADAKTMFNAGMSANVLITNVYWTPTASRFWALVSCVKPRVIFVHGKPALLRSAQMNLPSTLPRLSLSKAGRSNNPARRIGLTFLPTRILADWGGRRGSSRIQTTWTGSRCGFPRLS